MRTTLVDGCERGNHQPGSQPGSQHQGCGQEPVFACQINGHEGERALFFGVFAEAFVITFHQIGKTAGHRIAIDGHQRLVGILLG